MYRRGGTRIHPNIMEDASMSIYRPTYLYIKQHSITGKLYFGKTVRDPEKYMGSGSHWVNHINKHGKEYVVNLWYCLFYDEVECNKFALMFSEQNNIVESKEWLNQVPESGLCGNVGVKFSEEHKAKLAEASSKFKHTEDTKQKLREMRLGTTADEETKRKMSETRKGKPTWNKGKTFKMKTIKKCIHCGFEGFGGAMSRFHFDNCKMKNA